MRDHIYRCENPGCDTWQQSADPAPITGWLLTHERGVERDFCSWECAIRYGASLPPVERVPWGA